MLFCPFELMIGHISSVRCSTLKVKRNDWRWIPLCNGNEPSLSVELILAPAPQRTSKAAKLPLNAANCRNRTIGINCKLEILEEELTLLYRLHSLQHHFAKEFEHTQLENRSEEIGIEGTLIVECSFMQRARLFDDTFVVDFTCPF
jgi:hypothetical protein